MLKREYFIIYHNYYNLPVASPCLQTPDWGLRTRQQVSSSSWLQEASRSQAARLRPAYSFLRHQPHSSAASGFSTPGISLIILGPQHSPREQEEGSSVSKQFIGAPGLGVYGEP